MKITSSSTFEKTIETNHIPFCVLKEGKISSECLKFKVEIQSPEAILDVRIGEYYEGNEGSSGISLKDWFSSMLNQKLIITENSEVEKYFEQTLFVNDASLPYITKTLFQILERLLPENLTLISLEYQ